MTVTALCPGPVKTGFQDASGAHDFASGLPKPLWRSAEQVAAAAVDGLERGKRIVVPGNRGLLEHAPADLRMHVRALGVPRPRPQHVGGPDQLDAAPAEPVDLAREQPVDHQEAAMVRVALERRRRVPHSGREPGDARQRAALRALDTFAAFSTPEALEAALVPPE